MTPVEVAAVGAAISMTLTIVVTKLAPSVMKWYSFVGGMPKDLEELLEDVKVIRGWLEETGYEAMVNDPFFDWLKRLREVAYDVDDVVDEFQLQAEKHEAGAGHGILPKCICMKTKLFNLQCKEANKIKKIKKKFAAIVKKRSDFSAIANNLQVCHPVRHMNETTFEMPSLTIVNVASILGRDQDKDLLITELVKSNGQQEIATISVIGLGGSGKTTLAQLICNDTKTIKKHFEFTLWVHVSQNFNVKMLIEKLFEAITKEKSDKHPLQHISEEISERLNGKKFLLVLDDVWTTGGQIQWDEFMVHLKSGAPGSKILVTTRSRRVAETMKSIYIFDLPVLSFDDSWQLFHHCFGAGVERLSSDFQKVGKEILEKCGGLPLAIKSIAGLLGGMGRRIEDWQAMRDSNLLDGHGEDNRVSACLRLSYSHLQYNLKRCFIICSVFPKGHNIDKEQLIDLWIAHDMIPTEYIGNRYFNSLVQISFLQNVGEGDGRVKCKMHDMVHELAQCILGDEISLVVPKELESSTMMYRYFSLREEPEDSVPKNIFGKARAVYITKCYDYIFGMALKNAKHLRSVTVESPYVTALPNAIFQMNNLKYLSMSRLNCEALPDAISDVWSLQALHITDSLYLLWLPESIGKLKKLRTLNLSGCLYLNRLPDSIGDCHMISNIDLWRCEDLAVLPNSIGRNKELRVLRLGCTRLSSLPSITMLENLQCLDLRWCHNLVELPEGIENLKKLEVLNLQGCGALIPLLVLKGQQLDQVQNLNISVLRRDEKFVGIPAHTNLIIDSSDADQTIINTYVMEDDVQKTCLKQKTHLQGLKLEWMAHDTAEVDDESVQGILDDLEPPPGIKTLDIHGYLGTQYARWMQNQVGGGVQGPATFPFLRVMSLIGFPNLENLHGLVELPCLEELNLQDMPSLESISGGPFPSLVKLKMHRLPCLAEVWMIAERTMPDGEEGGGCYNFTPQLGQVILVGNCLTELGISGCPKLEVKPHIPLSLQHLQLSSSEQLLQPLGQCQGSSSPPSFNQLKKLELRNVTGLGSGHRWELLQHMTSLDSLWIIGFPTELPDSLWSLTSLRSLKVSWWSNIRMLPESIGELRSLQDLSIVFCHSLTSLPQSMGHLTSLQELEIGWCDALHQLPDCLGELCSLRRLQITHLPELICLPQSICRLTTSLQKLKIVECPGITSLPQGMEGLVSLEKLSIWNCRCLTSLPQGMKGLVSLGKLSICNCPRIQSLPEGIKDLTALKELQIWGCHDLQRRCNTGKQGEDWHLISHIPRVMV